MTAKGALRAPLIWGYIIMLHAAVITALFFPKVIDDQRWRSAWLQKDPSEFTTEMRKIRRAQDAYATAGAVPIIGDSHAQFADYQLFTFSALNLGIGDDKMTDIAARIGDYQSVRQGVPIVIWAGFNDLIAHRSAEDIVESFRAAAAQLPPKRALIVLGVPPLAKGAKVDLSNDQIRALNSALLASCTAQCTFVDTSAILTNDDGDLDPRFARSDKIHLSGPGYDAIAQKLNAVLAAGKAAPAI